MKRIITTLAAIAALVALVPVSQAQVKNPVDPDRAQFESLKADNKGFAAWIEECEKADREVLTTAEFKAKYPDLAGKIDKVPYHCYRKAKKGAVKSLSNG